MTRPTSVRSRSVPLGARLALACAVALGSAACGGGGGGDTPQPPALESIDVAPGSPSVAKGLTQAFTATGRYSDASTLDLTALATWGSSSGAATMAGAVATGAAEGEATITASYGGRTGQATLTVTAAELVSIAVDPDAVSLAEGLTTTLVATGTWSDGSTTDLTATATWDSDDLLAASVVAGVVTAVGQGEAIVTASQDGRSGQATVSVTAAALQRIAISPASVSLAKGLTQQLGATGHYTDGTEQDLTALALWSSEGASIAGVDAGLVRAVGLGTTTVSAGWDGQVETATVEVTDPALQSIEVAPASPTVAKGLAQAFTATGRYSDASTQDLTAVATWTSSSTGVATMAGAVATGVTEGTTTISAAYDGRSGETTLAVTSPVIQGVEVAPGSATLAKGLTQAFTATARWSDATTSDVTATASWTTDDPSVAKATGNVVTASAVGSTRVHALAEGVLGSADVVVTEAAVATLTLSPVNATLPAGTSRPYDAVAVYTDGSKRDVTAEATWAATPEGVATVDAGGRATGVAPGAATVSASYAGVSAGTPLTVTSAVLLSLSLSPSGPTVPLGVEQAFTATGIFSDGTRQDLTAQVTWTSTPDTVATIAADGVATPVAQGTATISAARGGVSASTTLAVTGATLDALAVDPPGASIAAGTSAPFTATGIYSDGSTADLTALAAWSSSDAAVATISSAAGSHGVATGVAAGVATLTATFGGRSDAAELTVTDAYLVAIAVTPSGASAPAGTTQPLVATGTFSDGSTQDLTAAVGWTSSDPAVASVSNAPGAEGVVTALVAGTVTVTAASGGVTGVATFTVTDVALVSVEVTPATATLPAGYTRRYVATARYSDLSARDVTTEVTWQSSNTAVATISNAVGSQGLATGVAASATPVQLTATLPGATGSASLTVTNATLQSVAVTPNPFAVAVGGKVQLVATGTFNDGTVLDVTSVCAWTTSSRTVARVSRAGTVTGIAAGSVTITAKKKSRQGTAPGTVG